MNQTEDSFPSRPFRSVIDQANELCMLARKAKAARARRFAADRYLVETGYQHNVTTHFSTFAAALAFFVDHLTDEGGFECAPRILGAGHDGEGNGLTRDESEAVYAALELVS